ncbi:MAG TPA: hypothetical protein PLF30_01415 [Candidatus Moranbacteria bacterium]|jgi:cation:H+ antiporter|nr:sodium:calcium antiporter [Candidatus Moranbacteria bacterium]HPX94195.1 hypothetical protein [Candidatus Moranbacteria bacterium]HQB59522.1 hypothetical protein [Candidatus Moranbacteria bacterium]
MEIFLNILLFFFACFVIWKSSGMTVNGIEKFSKSLKLSSFATSFLLLGVFTSISEISVGINSVLSEKPGVFVGNLIGGSFVLLLLVIPVLAIFNRGIMLKDHISSRRLLTFLFIIICPSLLILDGMVSTYDGLLLIFLYGLFIYFFQKQHSMFNNIRSMEPNEKNAKIIGKIIIGVTFIYFSAKILVDKTVFFANILEVPPFLISLLVLSIGTNLPEIAIAFNSIKKRRPEIAFGNYVGSAAVNSLIFGVLTFANGSFEINKATFEHTFFIILFGYVLFFLFARTKDRISASEGLLLLFTFLIFLFMQTTEMLLVF